VCVCVCVCVCIERAGARERETLHSIFEFTLDVSAFLKGAEEEAVDKHHIQIATAQSALFFLLFFYHFLLVEREGRGR
jgi:hypothetical protein